MRLWYDEPAEDWNHALPVGGGKLGAMVFGGVSHGTHTNERRLDLGGTSRTQITTGSTTGHRTPRVNCSSRENTPKHRTSYKKASWENALPPRSYQTLGRPIHRAK